VPAPPPKENIWEKRKSENQASRQQQQSSGSVAAETGVESTTDKVSQSKPASEPALDEASIQSDDTASLETVSQLHYSEFIATHTHTKYCPFIHTG